MRWLRFFYRGKIIYKIPCALNSNWAYTHICDLKRWSRIVLKDNTINFVVWGKNAILFSNYVSWLIFPIWLGKSSFWAFNVSKEKFADDNLDRKKPNSNSTVAINRGMLQSICQLVVYQHSDARTISSILHASNAGAINQGIHDLGF